VSVVRDRPAYGEQVLAPELRSGHVVVMDSLPSQNVGSIREAIEQTVSRPSRRTSAEITSRPLDMNPSKPHLL